MDGTIQFLESVGMQTLYKKGEVKVDSTKVVPVVSASKLSKFKQSEKETEYDDDDEETKNGGTISHEKERMNEQIHTAIHYGSKVGYEDQSVPSVHLESNESSDLE
jgi:hypothetical protein